MARIQSSVSPQRPNPLTVAMVHTGYLKFATERNIVPNRNAAHHEKARTTLLVDRNQGVNAWNSKGGTRMADDEKLKPDDFQVHTEEKKILKNDGKTIADASDEKVAEDVAERLNAEEDLREEDRWSA